MTEFISRKCGTEGYEVIIKTDSEKHYNASVGFARGLIDHEKPKTNADKIRAMSDRELAAFFAGKFTDHETTKAVQKGEMLTATYVSEMAYTWYAVWMQWLQQPAEVSE